MSYDGDEKGLDLSWSSDLKDAQPQQDGETISGTTEDDFGDETTTVGSPDDTDLEKRIKREKILHPNATNGEIAESVGCSRTHVWRVLDTDGDWMFRESLDDLSDKQRRILEMKAQDNGLTQRDIGNYNDVTEVYVCRIIKHNQHLLDEIRQKLERIKGGKE